MSSKRTTIAWCPRCGIVRRVALPAWCRHNAVDQPARRMEPIPAYHPLALRGGAG